MNLTLHALVQEIDGWFIGWVEELPGVNVQERTIDEVLESLQEAVQLVVESRREITRDETRGKPVHRQILQVAV